MKYPFDPGGLWFFGSVLALTLSLMWGLAFDSEWPLYVGITAALSLVLWVVLFLRPWIDDHDEKHRYK